MLQSMLRDPLVGPWRWAGTPAGIAIRVRHSERAVTCTAAAAADGPAGAGGAAVAGVSAHKITRVFIVVIVAFGVQRGCASVLRKSERASCVGAG